MDRQMIVYFEFPETSSSLFQCSNNSSLDYLYLPNFSAEKPKQLYSNDLKLKL